MTIFVLEDDPDRQELFLAQLREHAVVLVSTYEEACVALRAQVFDLAFLDHDLSFAAAAGHPGANEKTGYEVAQYIVDLPEKQRPAKVVIHSWNTNGALRMKHLLRDAGVWVAYRPFGSQTEI